MKGVFLLELWVIGEGCSGRIVGVCAAVCIVGESELACEVDLGFVRWLECVPESFLCSFAGIRVCSGL